MLEIAKIFFEENEIKHFYSEEAVTFIYHADCGCRHIEITEHNDSLVIWSYLLWLPPEGDAVRERILKGAVHVKKPSKVKFSIVDEDEGSLLHAVMELRKIENIVEFQKEFHCFCDAVESINRFLLSLALINIPDIAYELWKRKNQKNNAFN